MELHGTVLSWKDGIARVQVAVNPCSACSHPCAAHSTGSGRYLLVESATPLTPGQTIVVDAPLPSPGRAVMLAYVLPLAGFMAGLFAGHAGFHGAPLPALGGGLLGAEAAYAAVALLEQKRRASVVSSVEACSCREAGWTGERA